MARNPNGRTNRNWLELARITAVGAAGCVILAVAINYLMLFNDSISPVGRSFVSAALLGVVIGAPLFLFLGIKLRELRGYRQELNRVSRLDPLTSFFNGSAFSALVDTRGIGAAVSPGRRKGAFLVVEAEHLKSINRRFGHQWGDEALRVIADAIRASIRGGDLVGRVGSGEFGVFLPDATEENALQVGERIRAAVGKVYFAPGGSKNVLSVSVGGTFFEDQVEFDDMFREAEAQLYNAQELGPSRMELSHFGASAS